MGDAYLSIMHQTVSGKGYLHQTVSALFRYKGLRELIHDRANGKTAISKPVVTYAYEVWDIVKA